MKYKKKKKPGERLFTKHLSSQQILFLLKEEWRKQEAIKAQNQRIKEVKATYKKEKAILKWICAR